MIALLCEIGPEMADVALPLGSKKFRIDQARKQQAAYVSTLQELGVRVEFFRPSPAHACGPFVEDAAIVLPEVAVVARLEEPRQSEVEAVAKHLAQYRPIQRIRSGGLLGGDVMRMGSTLFVGLSAHTNNDGIAALKEIVDHYGYEIRPVEVRECFRLKSACSFIPPDRVVANPAWVDVRAFDELQVIPVAADEPGAANTLTLFGSTLLSAAAPKTEKKLQAGGVATRAIDISELEKVGGDLTRLALLVEARSSKRRTSPRALAAIRTPSAPIPMGHAVQAIAHGGVVYVSGQLPLNPASGRVVAGGIEPQTTQTLNNLAAVLSASGSSLARVLKMTIHLSDRKFIDQVDAILAQVMNGHRPARTIQTTRTLPAGCLLEIEVIAAVAEE